MSECSRLGFLEIFCLGNIEQSEIRIKGKFSARKRTKDSLVHVLVCVSNLIVH